MDLYIITCFGGSKERGNQIVVTPKAEQEKQFINEELQSFIKQGKSVKNFRINFEYKKNLLFHLKLLFMQLLMEMTTIK